MANFPHQRDRLQPAEALFDALPLSFADGITRMSRGAVINRAAAWSRVVLRHMPRDLQVPALFHKVPRVEPFVPVVFPDCFEAQLEKLLADAEPEVVLHAIRAVGEHRKRCFVSDVLSRLPDARLRKHAIEALANFGDTIVGTLGDHLCDPAAAMEVRREIPAVLQRIGTADAQRVLMDNLLEPDNTFRFRVISALNKLQRTTSAIPLDRELLETALQAEIMGHYRSYQILGMLEETPDQDDLITRGLRESMQQEVERIFRLMSLMHPHLDLHSAYVGLQSKERTVHDNALEF